MSAWTDYRDVPKARTPVVYCLVDPRTPRAPRYVGSTTNARDRLYGHQHPRNLQHRDYEAWKTALKAAGVVPMMIVLASCESADAAQRLEWRTARRWLQHGVAILGQHEPRAAWWGES